MKGVIHKFNNETRIDICRIIEGARLEILYWIKTLDDGYIARYGYQDPEIHNERSMMVQLMHIGTTLSEHLTMIHRYIDIDISSMASKCSVVITEPVSSVVYIPAETLIKIYNYLELCKEFFQVCLHSQKSLVGNLEEGGAIVVCEP